MLQADANNKQMQYVSSIIEDLIVIEFSVMDVNVDQTAGHVLCDGIKEIRHRRPNFPCIGDTWRFDRRTIMALLALVCARPSERAELFASSSAPLCV